MAEGGVLKCLECGYDLRAAMHNGTGEVCCPECGASNDPSQVRRQGISRRQLIGLGALLMVPAAVIIVICVVFDFLTGEAVFLGFCLLLSPAIIAAHCYGVYSLTETIVLQRLCKRRFVWLSVLLAVGVDILAFMVMIIWLV